MYNTKIIFEHYKLGKYCFAVSGEKTDTKGFYIKKSDKSITVKYSDLSYFTMAMGYLAAHKDELVFEHRQVLKCERLGIMLDCARNAVPSMDGVKRFIIDTAVLGYNYYQLYVEDCMEVDEEPYFGYMRGRYTKEQIKELDKFCSALGVELMPCVQTLAHLNNIFRHEQYSEIQDCGDILLVKNERTYKLIENVFKTVSECYSSKRINIGMDEAHMLGLGKYLTQNGYENKHEILKYHLKKIIQLCNKYGLKPYMWSDMFFRIALNGEYYDTKGQLENMPDEIKNIVPPEVNLIFWDYYHTDRQVYEQMLRLHKQLSSSVTFAAGAWKHVGFAPSNKFTSLAVAPALEACENHNISDILMTAWGDCGAECSYNAIIGVLITSAAKLYAFKQTDINRLAKLISGYTVDELYLMDLPNRIWGSDNAVTANPCKYLLFDDALFGTYSNKTSEETSKSYISFAKTLKGLADRKGKFDYLFETLARLCEALAVKADLSRIIRTAYINNDTAVLTQVYSTDIPELLRRLKKFYTAFKKQWNLENKPFGFEVQDARLGALIFRLQHIAARIKQYCKDRTPIEELESDFLPESEHDFARQVYAHYITYSQL